MSEEPQSAPVEEADDLNPPMRNKEYIELLAARDGKAGWTTKIMDIPDSEEITRKSGSEIAVFLAQILSAGRVVGLRMEVGKPVKIKYKVPVTGSRIDEEYLAKAVKALETAEGQATVKEPENLTQMSAGDYYNVVMRLATLVQSGDQVASAKYAQQVIEVLKKQTDSKAPTKTVPAREGETPGQAKWYPPDQQP